VRSILTVRSGGTGGPNAGEVVFRAPQPEGKRVMPARVADQVVDVLYGTVSGGTATRARQPFPVFGKTGTTNNSTDAWFVGCTRKLCIATWMGYDKLRPMVNVQGVGQVYGGTLPAEIFARTWDEYRKIKEAERNPGEITAPTPSAHPQVRETERPRPTVTRKPSPTKTPKPPPSKTPDPDPTPTPTDTGGPIDPPIGGGPSP
jgi:membrane peptidoglycan carboxypeptidase